MSDTLNGLRPQALAISLLIRARDEIDRDGHIDEQTRHCLSCIGFTSAEIESGINNLRSNA